MAHEKEIDHRNNHTIFGQTFDMFFQLFHFAILFIIFLAPGIILLQDCLPNSAAGVRAPRFSIHEFIQPCFSTSMISVKYALFLVAAFAAGRFFTPPVQQAIAAVIATDVQSPRSLK